MKKAVLFDLDGTLLNRDESVKVFINKQYNRLRKWVGHVSRECYAQRFIELDNHGYVWKDKVFQQLVSEFDLTMISWEFLLEDYITQFKYSCTTFPNMLYMLETLKRDGLNLGIITNGKTNFQLDNIKALDIEKYFDAILISEQEGIKKPDSQIFNRALGRLKSKPSECIFVGDHPKNDVEAAQNVGMTGIWKRDSAWENVVADFIIDDLIEIPFIVKNLNKR